jgi:hypothetical protein
LAKIAQASRSGRDMALPPKFATMSFHPFCLHGHRRSPFAAVIEDHASHAAKE